MERGQHRLNALLIAVASSLGILIGIVGAARREPGVRVSRPVNPASFEVPESVRTTLAPAAAPSEATATPAPTAEAAPADTVSRGLVHVSGYVTQLDGTGAALARIVLGKQHARADAQGHFELDAPAHQENGDLLAFLSGNEPALQAGFGLDLVPGETYETHLVLGPPTLTLAGHVRDESGEPAKNWTVEVDGRDLLLDFGLRERVRTDSDGSFTLLDVPAGVHVVRAWRDEREQAQLSDPVEAGAEGVRIVVRQQR